MLENILNKDYPIQDGIINALPEDLNYKVEVDPEASHFFDVHRKIMNGRKETDFIKDKGEMAKLQKDFYDQMALGFQKMDNTDQLTGGIFYWKIKRLVEYDKKFLKPYKLLFVGAGNCRLARLFAQQGYYVVSTDISMNMLREGKQINDKTGIPMTYVAHNAEEPFPFKDGVFDSSYSLCVANHIVDWDTYFKEKLRCTRKGGSMLERMPNADLWHFWMRQGELYEGVEAKAQYCKPSTAKTQLTRMGAEGEIWTHDHQTEILSLPSRALRRYNRKMFNKFLSLESKLYNLRSFLEDKLNLRKFDGKGIYTMIYTVK